ncbi:hypothetical protein [Nocardioides taihuensis]|uniref:ARB-07466-like C-terminal domain-containing protein n=1 Tax=Nocardioides taihuensis TaxID=1835606 RepID=A0ABW0BJC2_9ACTN
MDARAHTDDHTLRTPATTGPGRVVRVVAGLVLALLLAPLLALAAAGPASAKIEDYPAYQPQTRCSPAAKVGTLRLATYLLHHGGGDLGISRSCTIGGTSEHKEGRAFDWALDATSKHDRKLAMWFIDMVRETDERGNEDAVARRMGIMYILWNDHSWSAWNGYEKADYLSSSCKSVKKCSVTLRHRNHVHVSITRPAARGELSWYTRHGVTPVTPTS